MSHSQGVFELCIINSLYVISVVLQYVCTVIFFQRWRWRKKHVRYIYPTMQLPLCLFVTCMSLYSTFLLFSFSVRQYNACNFHTLSCVSVHLFLFSTCVLCLHVFFVVLLLSFNSTYSLFPVWTKAPPALFLKGILPVSDCMCLMHFGSLSPQHLTAFLSVLQQIHLFLSPIYLPAFLLYSSSVTK